MNGNHLCECVWGGKIAFFSLGVILNPEKSFVTAAVTCLKLRNWCGCSTEYHQDAWWQASDSVKYEHCEEVDYAERTVINYWLRYCPWALEFGDMETLARTHNGGPCYWHHFSTTRYWWIYLPYYGFASQMSTICVTSLFVFYYKEQHYCVICK